MTCAVAAFAGATRADIDQAVAAARRAFESGPWPSMGPSARSQLLWNLAAEVTAHQQVLTELEILDNGMPLNPAAASAPVLAAKMLRYYAGWPGKFSASAASNTKKA